MEIYKYAEQTAGPRVLRLVTLSRPMLGEELVILDMPEMKARLMDSYYTTFVLYQTVSPQTKVACRPLLSGGEPGPCALFTPLFLTPLVSLREKPRSMITLYRVESHGCN